MRCESAFAGTGYLIDWDVHFHVSIRRVLESEDVGWCTYGGHCENSKQGRPDTCIDGKRYDALNEFNDSTAKKANFEKRSDQKMKE
jgi:hypothetical protein